jgi:hypothetical protein
MGFPRLRQTHVQTISVRMANPVATRDPTKRPHTFHAFGRITSRHWPTDRPRRDPSRAHGISTSRPAAFQNISNHWSRRRPIVWPRHFQPSGQRSSKPETPSWPGHVRVPAKEFPGGFQSFSPFCLTARGTRTLSLPHADAAHASPTSNSSTTNP